MKQFLLELLNCVLLSLGILSAGMGLKGFLLSSNFIDGGVTGVSMLLSKTTGLPLALLLPLVNLPFIAVGWHQLGRAFAVRSVLGIAGLALALVFIPYPDVTPDLVLTAVFGGFFLGAGIGLAVRAGAVIGATEGRAAPRRTSCIASSRGSRSAGSRRSFETSTRAPLWSFTPWQAPRAVWSEGQFCTEGSGEVRVALGARGIGAACCSQDPRRLGSLSRSRVATPEDVVKSSDNGPSADFGTALCNDFEIRVPSSLFPGPREVAPVCDIGPRRLARSRSHTARKVS